MPLSSNFYERVLNHIEADIVVYDSEYRYMFINQSAIKDPELREWLIGKTDEDYCRYRNKPIDMAIARRAIIDRARVEKRVIEWEDKLINKKGEPEYQLRYLYPVPDENGEMKCAIGYGFDITERVLAQEELRTTKETFASAFNHSGIGMALVGEKGNWLDVNQVLCDLTGYTREELLQLTFQDITHPDDLQSDLDLLEKVLRKEISTYSLQKRYIARGGKIVVVLLTVSAVWNADGTLGFFIAQAVDVSQQYELEQELNRKNATLEAAKTTLVNKLNQLEELNHIIAHNLRGPSGNIKLIAESLLATLRKKPGENSNPYTDLFTPEEGLELILESSISLMGSLSTLMEIAEIKLNKEIPYNDCDVKAIILDVTQQLNSLIYEKSAMIVPDIQVETISYPKAYLENIIYNLLSNALKYNRPGFEPEIRITTKEDKGRVQIIVKDNGLGINLQKHGGQVFKLNQVFHEGYDSKGVGLYITKTQVESLGGTIEVRSKVNEGCEFIVTL
jgi:PAS domain S-box-containing protein